MFSANDYNEIKGLKESIDEELLEIRNETQDLRKENNNLKKTLSESSTNLHTKQVEINNLLNEISQLKEVQRAKLTKNINIIQGEMNDLESKNRVLLLDNEKLQKDFETIMCNYEKLVSEKTGWLLEKTNWQQSLDDCTVKLTIAKDKEQLLLEELNKSVCRDIGDCSTCALLRSEIEQLNMRLNELRCKVVSLELEDKGGSRSPSRSYDKLQIKIEKLKNRLSTAEEQLKMEKHRNSCLEADNVQLKTEIQEHLMQFKEERLNMCTTISSFEEKLNKREDNYVQMQENKIEAEHEKECLIKNIEELQKKLETVTTMKDKNWNILSQENAQLKLELEELNKTKAIIEKKLDKAQILLKSKVQSDKKENAQLKQEIEDLNSQKSDVEGKLEKIEHDMKNKIGLEQETKDQLGSLVKENSILKEQIKELTVQKSSLEKRLEKCEKHLRNSETKRMSIRKELIDLQSLHENTILQNIECKNIEDLMKQKIDLQKQLKDCENELIEAKIKLSDSSNYVTLLSEYVKNVNEKLGEKRHRLNRYKLLQDILLFCFCD